MRRLAAVLIAVLSGGCATTKSPPAPPTVTRDPPADCLRKPTIYPYLLPDWWDKASPEDRAALELNAKSIDVAAVKERDAMLLDCRKWHGVK